MAMELGSWRDLPFATAWPWNWFPRLAFVSYEDSIRGLSEVHGVEFVVVLFGFVAFGRGLPPTFALVP